MKTFSQLMSLNEVAVLKKFFIDNNKKKYINWQVGDQIIDHRLTIPHQCPEFEIIKRIVDEDFPAPTSIWSAYQRQNSPHGIHIDDYGSDNKHFRYTYVIAMDTEPKFKTIVWKEKCWDNAKLHEFLIAWAKTKSTKCKISHISEIEDLEHTYDNNHEDYVADYLTLDGVFSYRAGAGVLFDATQLHCTSNWAKYPEFTGRELLQIHVTTATEINF